jgi:hypothetical protein
LRSRVAEDGHVEITGSDGRRVGRSNEPAPDREAEMLLEARLQLY